MRRHGSMLQNRQTGCADADADVTEPAVVAGILSGEGNEETKK
jgi:hypothetical protein